MPTVIIRISPHGANEKLRVKLTLACIKSAMSCIKSRSQAYIFSFSTGANRTFAFRLVRNSRVYGKYFFVIRGIRCYKVNYIIHLKKNDYVFSDSNKNVMSERIPNECFAICRKQTKAK